MRNYESGPAGKPVDPTIVRNSGPSAGQRKKSSSGKSNTGPAKKGKGRAKAPKAG